jgi:cysteine desulfurase
MNYFDYAASSPLYPEVLTLLEKLQLTHFSNPSAQHILGHTLAEQIVDYRAGFLKVLKGKSEDSFIFTSSATESNNTVIRGLSFNPGDIIIYCPADHPSITAPIQYVAKLYQLKLEKIILNKAGEIDLEHFTSLLNDKVKLVALTHVNNQSGVISDVLGLAKIIKERTSAHVHVDAVQSFGKIDFGVSSDIDSVSVTSHKIGGPKGIAGLFLKKDHKVKPLLLGGGQEEGMRSSTEAYPLIAGFHAAMLISMKNLVRTKDLLQSHHEKIKQSLLKADSFIQMPFSLVSPYILSFILPNISSDIILRHLESKDVFISTTSACSSKISGFNPSLAALNVEERHHKNFLRISMGAQTSADDVERLLREFKNTWDELKHLL